MPHPSPEQTARTRHIFARVMDGQSTAEIAAAEGVTVRRIPQIVAAELARTQSNRPTT